MVLRPVGRIADLARGPDDGLDLRSQGFQRDDRRVDAVPRRRSHLRQPHQLRADHEAVDAAGRDAQVGVVQHHRAVLREEGVDLGRRRARLIHGAGLSRSRKAGDAPPPGERRLLSPAMGIGQAIAGRHVHHDEGIEHHPDILAVQKLDRLGDGVVRRCPAKGRDGARGSDGVRDAGGVERRKADLAYQRCTGPRVSRDRPVGRLHGLRVGLDLGRDLALTGTQVGAEPGHDEAHRLATRQRRRELVHRAFEVGKARLAGLPVVLLVKVLGVPVSEPVGRLVLGRPQHELARARQQAHGFQTGRDVVGIGQRRAADDLRRDLRHAVAEVVERHGLEHEVADAPVGRHVADALDALDEAVGLLALAAVVEGRGVLAEVEQVAIAPHPAEADRVATLAERHREAQRVMRHLGFGALSSEPLPDPVASLVV